MNFDCDTNTQEEPDRYLTESLCRLTVRLYNILRFIFRRFKIQKLHLDIRAVRIDTMTVSSSKVFSCVVRVSLNRVCVFVDAGDFSHTVSGGVWQRV